MSTRKTHMCFVGNMLGQNNNYVTTQGQIVSELFEKEGFKVTTASAKINRLIRLVEIITTVINGRASLDIIFLEVYSGLGFVTADIVGRLSRFFTIPLIAILHGGDLPKFSLKYPNWTKRVLERADKIVAPSRYLAEELKHLDLAAVVIPNVIDLERYPFRERCRIAPNLIWMRSFHPIYNPAMAVEVLQRLLQSEPAATLTMAGVDKGLEAEVKTMVLNSGLGDAVKFVGFLNQNQKNREFSKADIYLNTNRIDNMPVSVIEACAMGLPVVSTNVGGVRYLIKHEENGLLGENEDVEEMSANVLRLLRDPELTRKISRNGRTLAERSAWEAIFFEWKKLLPSFLNPL